jgi:N-acetylmuramoyl-L-alanine amidase
MQGFGDKMIITRWTHIMIHHSATVDGRTFDWQAIRRYQMSWRIDSTSVTKAEYDRRLAIKDGKRFEPPWRDIGYQFGIELINNHYEIFVGRDLDQVGAHCVGMNDRAIGICFVGNFDLAPPPAEQWIAGVHFVRSLCRILHIPATQVVPHRDYAQKTCPGRMFDMERFRRDVASVS